MSIDEIQIQAEVAPADADYVEDQINRFNMHAVGAFDARALAGFVRAGDGMLVAGITGYSWAGMCEIQFLWVAEQLRGQGYGSALLTAAEREARHRGCRTMLLNTYSFQAPLFYEQRGYTVVGRAPESPPGHTSFTLIKALTTAAAP